MERKHLIRQQMGETFLSHVGGRLKEARAELGLKQEEAAELVGITREHWGRCERGIAMAGGEVWAALAFAGADVNYILTGSRDYEPPEPLRAEEQHLLDRYRDAAQAVRNAAMGALLGGSGSAAKQVFHVRDGGVAGRDIRTYNAKPKKPK